MKALAELLLDAGWRLTGSDMSLPNASMQMLLDRGLVIHQGHAVTNLPRNAEYLIYSDAVPADNPERQEADRRGLPQYTYSQMVARLIQGSTGVCLAGTHGKSTTTAMTACILDAAGRLSGAIVGAEVCERGRNGWLGNGDLLAVESCEFQRSFLQYHPRYAAILGIEHDHFDCYRDFASVESAFREFAEQVDPAGVLLFNGDYPACCRVMAEVKTSVHKVSFGLDAAADWSARDCQTTSAGMRFSLFHRSSRHCEIELAVHGRHNIANALAAAALCAEIGVPIRIICGVLQTFRGVRRRLQFVGDFGGRTFVDDYAHHPTAVKVTLHTLREILGARRMICVFQPHQVFRTRALMSDFATSFIDADEVWIAPVYAARESCEDEPIAISKELADGISRNQKTVRHFSSLDQIVTTLEDATRPNDVVVTMGAGDIDWVYHEFNRRIQ
jgi:UDP-N-acetylmuramate--alanine ligase